MVSTPPPAEPTPGSPYRVGNWTITQLKEELKQRNLSPAGKKQELIDRLVRYEEDALLATPRYSRSRASDKSPSRGRARSVSKKRAMSKSGSGTLEDDSLVTPKRTLGRPPKKAQEWMETPLKRQITPRRATPSRTATPKKAQSVTSPITSQTAQMAVATVFCLAFALLIPFILGQRPELAPARALVRWYLHWVHLGLANTASLGVNTWLSNLGPFVARVTSTAYVCKSLDFSKSDLTCPKGHSGAVNILTIYGKVYPDVLAWSIGSALGDLVPYILAMAFIAALKTAKGKISARILARIEKTRPRFGPTEALLLASLPSPLVEATGLLSGLFSLSFREFLRSVILGKMVIRGSLQALCVILVFSKSIVDPVLDLIKKFVPQLAALLHAELTEQRALYQQPLPHEVPLALRTVLKFAHLTVLLFMAFYTVLVMAKHRRSFF